MISRQQAVYLAVEVVISEALVSTDEHLVVVAGPLREKTIDIRFKVSRGVCCSANNSTGFRPNVCCE